MFKCFKGFKGLGFRPYNLGSDLSGLGFRLLRGNIGLYICMCT